MEHAEDMSKTPETDAFIAEKGVRKLPAGQEARKDALSKQPAAPQKPASPLVSPPHTRTER